jgi:glycosyltransferase involved in cell wall biosynthesis
VRQSLRVGEDALLVGSVGRLVPVKAFHHAIEAVALLSAQGGPLHLLIVGGGELAGELRELSRARGVEERVHLVGHQAEPARWLGAMDVFVNCSVSEGMSQALVEALALGLPTVVTDVGDNGDVVGGADACGLIVAPSAPGQLAAALAQLRDSARLRSDFSRKARTRYLSRYTQEAMLGGFEAMYGGLADRC